MENQKEHYRHILLFYFRKGKNASQARKKLRAVYGDEALKKNGSVKIGLTNFVLVIFHSKMKNALVLQLKLMMT